MNLAIQRGCVVVTQAEPVMPPPGPVVLPGLRAQEREGLLRLVDGPAESPRSWGVFASPEVAARTIAFFGGKNE